MLATAESTQLFTDHMHALVRAGGMVGKYCDRAEHAEGPVAVFVEVGELLRAQAVRMAAELRLDLRDLYAVRLHHVEVRNPAYAPDEFDGAAAARAAVTWRDWQLAQLRHDRIYHPEVSGLSKYDQVRHFAFHLQYLTWLADEACASPALRNAYVADRVPDVLLFGLKFATIAGQHLQPEMITVLV
jgi:hypothetical protein